MRRKILFLLGALCCLAGSGAQTSYEEFFTERSLRVDFALSGDRDTQSAAVGRLREEPVWGGPRRNLIDRFGYGGYYVNVYDKRSGKLIYSRGFNTLFEEWRSTEQAKHERQSWTNSVSLPYPKQPIEVEITARDKSDMRFHPLLRQEIDPASIFIDRGSLGKSRAEEILKSGEPREKVDLVFLAEGYTADEQEKFLADSRRFMASLFSIPPFDKHKSDFNVWAVGTVSEESGTDVSGKGIYRNTALGSGYYTFGVDRYLTTPDMKSIRDAVWNVPCDAVFILVNVDTYGGGGMYNFYAMGTAGHPKTPEVFVHEFGHSFAGLADEYFDSEVAYQDLYNLAFEPWEPNITSLVDFGSKWQDLLPAGTPVPTPVDNRLPDRLGVFEGGGYVSKGIYRPKDHCMMRDLTPFCPVCARAIERMIDYYCDRSY